MTDQQMPARIWCDDIDASLCKEKVKRSHTSYVRADIAERMAEALGNLLNCVDGQHDHEWLSRCKEETLAALSAFRSATQDTEVRHD